MERGLAAPAGFRQSSQQGGSCLGVRGELLLFFIKGIMTDEAAGDLCQGHRSNRGLLWLPRVVGASTSV